MFGASSFQSGSSQPLSAARQNHCWPLMILMRGSPDVITAASISPSVRHGERQTAESAEESHTHLRADVQVRVAVRWEMGVWLASQVMALGFFVTRHRFRGKDDGASGTTKAGCSGPTLSSHSEHSKCCCITSHSFCPQSWRGTKNVVD